MHRRRSLAVALALVTALVAFVDPAAAQSVNRDLFERLNTQLIYVALPLMVFVELILVYAVVRFRNNDDAKPTLADPPLEVTWTVATAVILLFVGFSAYTVMGSPYVSPADGTAASEDAERVPPNATEIDVVAYQFNWEFRYEEANVTTRNELVVPTDRDVYLNLTSRDVLHSLFVPEWGVKQDAFPEKETLILTNVYEPGVSRLYCTELCGAGHSRMTGNATAVSQSTYDSWLEEHQGERGVTEVPRPESEANTTGATGDPPVDPDV